MSILRRRLDLTSSKRQLAVESRIPSTKERRFIENRLSFPLHRFTDFESYISAGSKQVWATFRACHLVASVIMGTDFKVVKPDQPLWTPNPAKDDEMFLLGRPNPLDSWKELLYMWVYHIKLTGCAFWLKDEINALGQPTAVYPLLPQYMRIVPDEKKNIAGFIYHVNGREVKFTPEEIIYFRRPHPASTVWGMGDIEPSEPLFNAFINRSTYEEKFMENGAQPSGVMTLKEKVDDPAEWAKLKSWWNTEYGGKKNAGKTAFLQGEWEYHKLGLDQQAMQSLEREKLTVEQIFINHGVPLSIAGILGAANYATAKQDELNFRKYEIVPLLEMFCGKLNREGALFPLFKNNTQLAYELSGLVDVEQVTKEYGPLLRLGAITPNEIRKLAGLNPVNDPYLDQYFIDSMLSPMEMAGLATVPPAPAPSKSADYRKLKLS